jgi:hypothetical protein
VPEEEVLADFGLTMDDFRKTAATPGPEDLPPSQQTALLRTIDDFLEGAAGRAARRALRTQRLKERI